MELLVLIIFMEELLLCWHGKIYYGHALDGYGPSIYYIIGKILNKFCSDTIKEYVYKRCSKSASSNCMAWVN